MSDIRAVRKYAAQHDLFNRLHSIAADERFVRTVAGDWYEGRFDVVPNQRCGNWYCDPSTSSRAYAYFKSTDGHMSHWDFNLRRSNLALATYAEQRGGLILVDSTRRGKRMPDALSKTVPIWCAVINLAISIRHHQPATPDPNDWDTTLYLPPQIVPATERAQIEARMQGWAEALERSALPLPELQKPLRPFFIHPSTSLPPHIPLDPGFTPIICLSASRWVNNGSDDIPSVTRLAKRTVGFEYVPGGGDDDELWARHLTPTLFHAHKEAILSAERDDLPELVDRLVAEASAPDSQSDAVPTSSSNSHAPLVGVPGPSSRLALDIGPSTTSPPPWFTAEPIAYIDVVEVEKYPKNTPFVRATPTGAALAVPSSKTDGKGYAQALGELVSFARSITSGIVVRQGDGGSLHTLVPTDGDSPSTVSTADIARQSQSSRKLILPLALILLCAIPTLDTPTRSEKAEAEADEVLMSKELIASKLHTLIALWPDGNPPRASLKRVNEYLMSDGRR